MLKEGSVEWSVSRGGAGARFLNACVTTLKKRLWKEDGAAEDVPATADPRLRSCPILALVSTLLWNVSLEVERYSKLLG